ncbi:MAG TPA: AAA family ATPase [Acetobacteraceae bacterium]|nr:AAA family ATPase [Acetobacteraceae bacterium]
MPRLSRRLLPPPAGATLAAASAETRRVLRYAAHVHAATDRRAPEAHALVCWALRMRTGVGLAAGALPSRCKPETPLTAQAWAHFGAALADAHDCAPRGASLLDKWLGPLARTLRLSEIEAGIIGLVAGYRLDGAIEALWDEVSDQRGNGRWLRLDATQFALLLGKPEARLHALLGPEGRLRESGLLSVDEDGDIALLPRVASQLAARIPPGADIRAHLLGRALPPTLPWAAFAHLGAAAEQARTVLQAARAGGERGVNILLYGPPGTGKTSFAATLAAATGAVLHPVGEAGADGEEPGRTQRLSELRLGQALLAGSDSVLLFDEAEDIGAGGLFGLLEGARPSRVFLHRLIENNPVPVIWTANDITALGPAMVRRMMLCLELRLPDAETRAGLWRRIAAEEQVELAPADAQALARQHPAAPALARNALRAARLSGGDAAAVRLAVSGVARAVNGGRLPLPEPAAPEGFDPAFIAADQDLPALADRLCRPGANLAVSLLLSGPPGSGKSAFARHLAERMELPILVKRASDLLGKYVGQSEKRIAGAFAEAREREAFLVFDEADSLLGDRRDAQRSWEITQVNEMLTWMEDHPLPFACTTNLIDRLDRASLRRFLVKARFGYLSAAQAEACFTRFFALPAPAALGGLSRLTPADFALVRRRMALLDDPGSPDALAALLAAESAEREGGGRIGFGR